EGIVLQPLRLAVVSSGGCTGSRGRRATRGVTVAPRRLRVAKLSHLHPLARGSTDRHDVVRSRETALVIVVVRVVAPIVVVIAGRLDVGAVTTREAVSDAREADITS